MSVSWEIWKYLVKVEKGYNPEDEMDRKKRCHLQEATIND